MEDYEDITFKKELMYNIKYLWRLCRYSRGKVKGSMPPILIYLSVNHKSESFDWMPLKLEEETPENIYVTAAAILQDNDVPVVLFLTDTYTETQVPEKAYMMVSFMRSGLGPVVTSSISSCINLYANGPKVIGNFSEEGNQEIIQEYLDNIEDEVVKHPSKLPKNGYCVSEIEEFEIDGVSSYIFNAHLSNFNTSLH